MKYKVGDRVRVQNKDYFVRNYECEDDGYRNRDCSAVSFINNAMLNFCDTVVTITHIRNSGYGVFYGIKEDDDEWSWADWMFEGKVEEDKEENKERVGNSNIIKDLCDYLNISVGQVIISKDSGYKYRFTETSELEVYEDGDWKVCCSFPFNTVIKMIKEYKFVTKWIPKDGETVYIINFNNGAYGEYYSYLVFNSKLTYHNKLLESHMLYKTKEEAIEAAKEYMNKMKGENKNEV